MDVIELCVHDGLPIEADFWCLTRAHVELHVSTRPPTLLHLELFVVLSGREMVLSFLSDMFLLSFRHSKL